MNREDVVIGMRVVPRRKSIRKPLHLSGAHNAAKAKGQPYLYVAHQHVKDIGKSDRFLLSEEDIRFCGDYFMCSDFEPYAEETKDHVKCKKAN